MIEASVYQSTKPLQIFPQLFSVISYYMSPFVLHILNPVLVCIYIVSIPISLIAEHWPLLNCLNSNTLLNIMIDFLTIKNTFNC